MGGKKSKAARGFLLGQVMQKTKEQANYRVDSDILRQKLVDFQDEISYNYRTNTFVLAYMAWQGLSDC